VTNKMSQKLHEKYDKDRANALILVVISMPLIMLLLSLNFNIGKDISTKNIFNNVVQSAAQAAVKTVDNRSVLGNAAVQTFVTTYDKLISTPDASTDAYIGSGMEADTLRSRGECATMEIDGVKRKLPYMEISLSENRGNSLSASYSTETWKLDGNSRKIKEKPLGNVQYKVLKAVVWEATPNFFFGAGVDACHLQKAEASAIAFGSQADLEEQVTLSNKVEEPRDINITLDKCISSNTYSLSGDIKIPKDHSIEILKVTGADGKATPYTDLSKGIKNDQYPLQLDSKGRTFIYKLDSDFNYNGSYVNIQYAFSRINTEGKKIISGSAVAKFADKRDPECAIAWPSLGANWFGVQSQTNLRSAHMVVPKDAIDYMLGNSPTFEIIDIPAATTDSGFHIYPFTESTVNAYWSQGNVADNQETTVSYKLKHKATGKTKTYTHKVFIHPEVKASNFNYNPASGEVVRKVNSGIIPSANVSKYFSYAIVRNTSNDWLNTKLVDKDTISVNGSGGMPSPGNKSSSYTYRVYPSVDSSFEFPGSKADFNINYQIPAPKLTRGYYNYTLPITTNKALEWKEVSNTLAEKNKYINKFDSIYGILGLDQDLCRDTSARMFIKTIKGSNDIAISLASLKDHALIKNKTPELITALESTTGNASNVVCYIETR